jgi:SAM-dependent methyltransferase
MAASAKPLGTELHPPRGSTLPGDFLLRCDTRIFLVSALILYLELMLIRWIGTEIRIFAYLGNLILVVCFFGVGLGCYQASRPVAVTRLGLNLLLLALLVGNPLHVEWLGLNNITVLLSGFDDSAIWDVMRSASILRVAAALGVIGALLYLVAFTFVPTGQILGRAFQEHPGVIRAYSFNIGGSLAGVWLFDVASWASWPPEIWFGLAAVLVAAGLRQYGRQGWLTAGLAGAAALLVWCGRDRVRTVVWSPYQKLAVSPYFEGDATNRVQRGYLLEVNGAHFQYMVDSSAGFFGRHPDLYSPESVSIQRYNGPFGLKPNARRILIVGAGTGNNAAEALRRGAEQIDCVEIDPQIYALGRRMHPEHPYDSPRVRMTVNDARAFFKQARGPYDVIWFAWLDAHSQASSYNNLRLDHYVYTEQSILEAKRLLADDGLIFVNFNVIRPWISDRLFVLLRDAFGHDPLVYRKLFPGAVGKTGTQYVLASGYAALTPDAIADPTMRALVAANVEPMPGVTRPTTDDWPYLYLNQARIPKLHLLTSLMILGTVTIATRRSRGIAQGLDWHFFALGAAFLLLEVQTVSRATLLFGMTWIVNAIVISAVLIMILLSNLVAWRWPRFPQWAIFSGLAITVAALAVVPLDWFNALTGAAKLVTASAFLTAPVFFGGLIFIQSFATCPDKARALGSNLLGALVGGLLESVSFVTGIRALVILVGVFYLIAILGAPRQFDVEHSGAAP